MATAEPAKRKAGGAEQDKPAAKTAKVSAAKDVEEFRNYDSSDRQSVVENHYRLMRQNQTFEFVKRMQKKYCSFDHAEMEIWEAFQSLGNYVDRYVDTHHQDAISSRSFLVRWFKVVGALDELQLRSRFRISKHRAFVPDC